MADRPLLIFSTPTDADRSTLGSGNASLRLPTATQQSERLDPIFFSLQQVMDSRQASFIQRPDGLPPEEVLIIEVAGNVSSFWSVCKNTEGLEWLVDSEYDPIYENDTFRKGDAPKHGSTINTRLLLTMTNQTGIQNLLSYWSSWKENPNTDFPRGLNGWKNIFPSIIDIRRWGIKERFEETGVLENWEFELEHQNEIINFEVELWFRDSELLRNRSSQEVKRLINNLEGLVINEVVIPEIRYHALLVEMNLQQIESLVKDKNIGLLKSDQIMFFKPTGQTADVFESEGTDDLQIMNRDLIEPLNNSPEIALLDGLPLQNHILLSNHIVIDDPDGFEEGYLVSQRKHGTSMSSIILNGDLSNENSKKLDNKIYVRPILKFDAQSGSERVPKNRLIVNLVYESIIRIFGDDNNEPVSRNIKVINLSIGDSFRPFYYNLSSLARLIDWLSYKYNVLFLVSAGNNTDDLCINTIGTRFEDFTDEDIQLQVLKDCFNNQRTRRLISPAESINALTIGALHSDHSNLVIRNNQINTLQKELLPSPINPIGGGFKRSVKPELFFPGGRLLHRVQSSSATETKLRIVQNHRFEPGIKVAYPGAHVGDLNGVAFTSGTSNATAFATNFSGNILSVIHEINEENGNAIPEDYIPVLLKTLLTHTFSWGEVEDFLKVFFGEFLDNNRIKDSISRLIGFGTPNQDKAYECDINQASIFGFGALSKNEGHLFTFPLPTALSGIIETKKLTISLAWFSPVNPGRQNYRKAHLFFDLPDGVLRFRRDETHARTAKRGTVQHEVMISNGASPIVEGDSLRIKVSCREDSGILNEEIKYGLCVTLESINNLQLPIYEQVRDRINVQVPIRTENR